MDYMVFEVLSGHIIGNMLRRFDTLAQAESWCDKSMRDWKFNSGVEKEYLINYQSMRVAHYHWNTDTGSLVSEHWNDNGGLSIMGTSKGVTKMRCPTCGKTAKRIKSKKFPGWYYCHNPSCNTTAFNGKS